MLRLALNGSALFAFYGIYAESKKAPPSARLALNPLNRIKALTNLQIKKAITKVIAFFMVS